MVIELVVCVSRVSEDSKLLECGRQLVHKAVIGKESIIFVEGRHEQMFQQWN